MGFDLRDQTTGRKSLAVLAFAIIQTGWLPISILGVVLVGFRQLYTSKKLGVSQTAVEIINGRWAMDAFGLREDSSSKKLAHNIPNNSVMGLWLALFPLWAVRKLFNVQLIYPKIGAPEQTSLTNLVPSRTVLFDNLIRKNAQHFSQLVILGAGLDTRAYGDLKEQDLDIFELDESVNQNHKIRSLSVSGIDSKHVVFLDVNFADNHWIESLINSKYSPKKKTIFLWEGVTLYLSEQAIVQTLSALKNNAAKGSVVLTDLYSLRLLNLTKHKALNWSLKLTNEQTNFGLDFSTSPLDELKRFAKSQALQVGDYQFLGGANKKGPFAVIAELKVE
jgi:methyltransferase (TIGR00027 family)